MKRLPVLRPRALPRPSVALAWTVLVLLVLAAAFPGLFTGKSPIEIDAATALRGPGPGHWFGTDQLGRDQFARVVHGARPSLLVGLGSIAFAVVAGALYGLASALLGRTADRVLMGINDIVLALPQLLLALLALAILGSGQLNVMVAIALAFLPGYARLVRAEALVVRNSGYVETAVTLGQGPFTRAFRHVLPNALGPLLVLASTGFGMSLISVSALSFLGFGARPPTPEWGVMLSEGRGLLQTAWWLGVFPGAAITLTVVAVTVAGRAAQARFTRRTAG
ncbi:ABC transporter permease [Actinocorallia sp. API 0066]|uniref:ABC transporter permease n=1 Tax=Actinocorallia sp. API 0066 TaxID=2896846 RepID=UPI001E4EADFF|nr:ABC transporter permease [Actinocorallia sp. API 0066]MCD0449830.1 ABC transporter permease [Actinocorallia sp. API 0066]